MIIRINGRVMDEPIEKGQINLIPPGGNLRNHKAALQKVRRILLPLTAGLSLLSHSTAVLAATPARGVADNLMPIVHMLQDFAFPVGLGIGIWGLIEYIMDNPAGKEKVKKAIIGYIGIFVLPSIFTAIRDAFNK